MVSFIFMYVRGKLDFKFLLRWGSPAKQSGGNEEILFKLWRKEISKIPDIFTLFH